MDEAVEQRATLAWPALPDAPEADWVLVEQRALHARVGGAVASLPFGIDGQVVCALCVEHAAAFDAATLTRLQQLVAPGRAGAALDAARRAVAVAAAEARAGRRRRRTAPARAARDAARAGRAGAGAAVRAPSCRCRTAVGGRARIEGAEQRVLSAPTDGFVHAAHVRPGDRVKAGDVLVDLLEQDLRLERERWLSQLAQHENAYAAAMARADRVAASTSLARIDEAQAQLALVDEQLQRGRIVAPFDALVVQGDLSQSIGAPVRQGDALLTLATTAHYRVIVEVDESDIARVSAGQGGSLSLSSLPWQGQALLVERIAPLAKAVDGRNVFEVEARLARSRCGTAPGAARPRRARRRPHAAAVGLEPACGCERLRLAWWAWLG